ALTRDLWARGYQRRGSCPLSHVAEEASDVLEVRAEVGAGVIPRPLAEEHAVRIVLLRELAALAVDGLIRERFELHDEALVPQHRLLDDLLCGDAGVGLSDAFVDRILIVEREVVLADAHALVTRLALQQRAD